MSTGKCRWVPTKKNKAELATELVSPAEAIRTPSTCITDGMGLVQRINGNNKTFAQPAESVLSMVLVGLMLSLTHTASRSSKILKD